VSRRPNILMFIADQLRADHLRFGGNPVVQTPHLDRLASSSVVFDRAYVANPTCMPNRATLVTGRWPSSHGTRTNGVTLRPEAMTVVRRLAENGYRTAAVGKLHFQTMGWPYEPHQREEIEAYDPLLLDPGVPDAVTGDRPPGWDRYEDFATHRDERVELPEDYYGFQTVDLVVGHGDEASGHYRHWAAKRGYDLDELAGYRNATERYDAWEQVYRSEVPVEVYPTSYVTDRAVGRLEELAAQPDPFLLFCSYPDPHHPFSPPGDYWGRYRPDELGAPATFDADHHGLPEHVRLLLAERGRPPVDPTMTWAPTADQLRHAMAAEYGMIELLDDSVGRVLAALEQLRLAEDTIVVFTSDHGDLFGDHGLMLKHFVHYEGVTRVPLTVRVPGGAAGRRETLTSSADLVPTLLELTGTRPYLGIQGQSLVGPLTGATSQVRRGLLIEEEHPFGTSGLPGPARIRSFVGERGRLTLYGDGLPGELYDHETDPTEQHNLHDEPEGDKLRVALTEAMAYELVALADRGLAPTASA
jgi:arylsulfatase A-like enzyme